MRWLGAGRAVGVRHGLYKYTARLPDWPPNHAQTLCTQTEPHNYDYIVFQEVRTSGTPARTKWPGVLRDEHQADIMSAGPRIRLEGN